MARPARRPLNVYMNSRLAGRLRRESNGAVDFQYDRTWLELASAIPVSMSLPLREDRFIGAPVLAVFENLLPDDPAVRLALAARAGAEGPDAFSLLSAIGRDCVGALQFLPDGQEPGPSGQIDARPVSNSEIVAILANLGRNPLGIGDDGAFRISLAGAQEKTALTFWNNRWHVPHGTTATTHILKPRIGMLPNGVDLSLSVENEFLCLALASALGLPAAKAEMVEFGGIPVLAVERFDRRWTRDGRLLRLPQEDFCQTLSVPPARKYESDGGPGIAAISEFLKGSDTPEADRRLFLKAQVVFWLLGATDGHAKNFSIFLEPGGRFRLAPLYDILSAQPSADAGHIQKKQFRLAMATGANRHRIIGHIAARHFGQTARHCGYPADAFAAIAAELCDTGAAAIDGVLARLPAAFPPALAHSISHAAKHRLDLLTRV